jgi:U4/U6 small nuclear ribonucleoprotein PRP31
LTGKNAPHRRVDVLVVHYLLFDCREEVEMSLADELVADLGDYEDEEVEDVETNAQTEVVNLDDIAAQGKDVTTDDLIKRMELKGREIQSLSHLMTRLQPVLEKIAQSPPPEDIEMVGKIEDNPVYQLLVEANGYSVEIDNEIIVIHKFIKENYSKRFDELGSLVLNPVDYARATRAIGNDVRDVGSKNLKQFISGATIMIITMSAFENRGEPLSPQELDQVFQACDLLLSLDEAKKNITQYVSSRLTPFAPNITQIVSSHIAAQLMGFAGGLAGLSRTPAANIPTLGANRRVGIGFGNVGIRRQGFLYHGEIVQSVPPENRVQAMRILSGKIVLAARVDLVHAFQDGSQGLAWRKNINERIEKLLEPPENKGSKALKIPEDKPSKKRGGRKARKFKEQFAQTELQKAHNRMAFGQEEEQVFAYDESRGLGMAGAGVSSGKVRALVTDSKTRARMSKGMQARMNALGTKKEISGLASSLAFTPVQGIELIDPSRLAREKQTEDDRWFKSGTFTMINSKLAGIHEVQLGAVPVKPMAPPTLPVKRKMANGPESEAKKQKQDNML